MRPRPRLVSHRSPFIPIDVLLGQTSGRFEALLDTGFDGDVVVPEHFTASLGAPDEYRVFRLADGSLTVGETFSGQVVLGPVGTFPARVVSLGDECLLGLGVAHRCSVLLDHGQRVIVEP
jgi:predicted aspartyl protease